MNIPHLPPVKFAREVAAKEGETVTVRCFFEEVPTIGMLLEAVAQSSAGFSDQSEQKGFLVQVKKMRLQKDPKRAGEYYARVEAVASMANVSQFQFEVLETLNEDSAPVAAGGFTIYKL